jgi:hypothetical protein
MLVATQITEAFAAQLRLLTAAHGYTTNVGAEVHVGMLRGAAEQAPACYLLPGRQSAGEGRYGTRRLVLRSYEVRAFVDLRDHPAWSEAQAVDAVIWDVRAGVETAQGALHGLAERLAYQGDRPGYREEGGTLVGAAIDYTVAYFVDLSDPTHS